MMNEFNKRTPFLLLIDKQNELQTEIGILKLTVEKLQPQIDILQVKRQTKKKIIIIIIIIINNNSIFQYNN